MNGFTFCRWSLVFGLVLLAFCVGVSPAAAQDRPKIEIVPRIPHDGLVASLALSADGSRVLSGGYDKTIKLWDTATGILLRSFEAHSGEVTTVAFSPDGALVLSGSRDKTVRLWNAATGVLLRTFEATWWINQVRFSPDGRRALGDTPGETMLWDTATGALLQTFKWDATAGSRHLPVSFSPDGRLMLSVSAPHSSHWPGSGKAYPMKLWDVTTGAALREFEGNPDEVDAVAFSSDGRWFLSGGGKAVTLWDDATLLPTRTFEAPGLIGSVALSPDGTRVLASSSNTMALWDAATGHLIRTFQADSYVHSVVFSPDGTRALSRSGTTIKLWDVNTGVAVQTFDGHSFAHFTTGFSPTDAFVLSSDHEFGMGGSIKLWNAATGALVRTFGAPSSVVQAVAFSPDGRRLLAGGEDHAIGLWDITSGGLVRTFEGLSHAAISVGFLHAGATVLARSEDQVMLWDASTGARTFEQHSERSYWPLSIAVLPDGTHLLSLVAGDTALKLWNLTTMTARTLGGHSNRISALGFSLDGTRVLSMSEEEMKLWDTATGGLIRAVKGNSAPIDTAALSPDGKRLLSSSGESMTLWDAKTGLILRTFQQGSKISAVEFSPDGARVLSAGPGSIKLWDSVTGNLLSALKGNSDTITSVEFSADGTRLLSTGPEAMQLWDIATGGLLRTFEGRISTAQFSPNGAFVLSGIDSRTVKLLDTATGALLQTFEGHSGRVASFAFSPDDRRIVTGSIDTTVRVWDRATGAQLAMIVGGHDGQWLVMTPAGFFAATHKGTEMLGVVRGLDITTIDQVHQSLYNPDLVREALAGDPAGEVAEAAKVVNLDKVIDSGPAPRVGIVSPAEGSQSPSDLVTVSARIEDRGKGVGRIEWRVNGITAVVGAKPAGPGPEYTLTQQLALDAGDNVIELVAYNGSNLLASLPARAIIKFAGTANAIKPKLHVLAIGINAYDDKGWVPPGQSDALYFSKLKLAAKDARDFGSSIKRAAGSLYARVRLTILTDAEATRDNLPKVIDRIAADVHPRDTFVLFAAAHGFSVDGRYYLIPQDYEGGPNPEALATRAIDQSMLQDWLANRIKAKKALILLDTCESGALVGGYARSRTDAAVSEAALGRLHEATGRPVLTAAAEGKPAFEGYQGHGVFTWSLIDALKNGDRNGNGTIELSEMVAHVQDQVPKIAANLNGRGPAAIVVRGLTGASQSARFGSKGQDFVLARRLE